MPKIGFCHSSGEKILPFGNAVLIRMMVEHWGTSFWDKWIGNLASKLAEIYQDRRTYGKQVADAISEGAKELLININSYQENYSNVKEMTKAIAVYIRWEAGFKGELIFTAPNEAPEHMNFAQYWSFTERIRQGLNEVPQANAKLSAGCQSAGDWGFYQNIFSRASILDYIDVHTSNDANVTKLDNIVRNSPKPVLISEHYLWDIANKYGYDSDNAINQNKVLFDYYIRTPKIKSVYLLFPSLVSGTRYQKLAMSTTDKDFNLIHKTRYYNQCVDYWNLFKEPDVKYNRPIDLQKVYDALGWTFPYNWTLPNLPVVGEKNPDGIVKWADIDALSETQYKAIIYALKKSGALPQDFPDYPDIKYINGVWNVNWSTKAKENKI